MAIVNQTEQRPKPSMKNEELGLRCELLSYALHGGGRSTCPLDYSVQNGSNDIVVTTLSGQQIIVNNLNNDYNGGVIYNVKHIFTMLNHRVSNGKG